MCEQSPSRLGKRVRRAQIPQFPIPRSDRKVFFREPGPGYGEGAGVRMGLASPAARNATAALWHILESKVMASQDRANFVRGPCRRKEQWSRVATSSAGASALSE